MIYQGWRHIPGPKHSNSQEQEYGVLKPRERLYLIRLGLLGFVIFKVCHKHYRSEDIIIKRTRIAERFIVLRIVFVEEGSYSVEGGSGIHGSDRMTTHNSRAIVVALVVEKREEIRIKRMEQEEFSSKSWWIRPDVLCPQIHLTLLIQPSLGRINQHPVTTWYQDVSLSSAPPKIFNGSIRYFDTSQATITGIIQDSLAGRFSPPKFVWERVTA
jgi:hypothetical protein